MSVDPSTVIRIAIAFSALKYKPRDQETASYVLDLQSQFPLNIADKNAAPAFQSLDSVSKWRAHALELEKQLRVLQGQRDIDQEELVRLRRDVSEMQAKISSSDVPPPKKKAKKNKEQQDTTGLRWNWELVRADWSTFLHSQYPPTPSLLLAYTTLRGALVSFPSNSAQMENTCENLEATTCRVADAIIRAVEAVQSFLFVEARESSNSNVSVTTSSCTPFQMAMSSSSLHARWLASSSVLPRGKYENITSNKIATSSPLLMYTLRTAFPALLHACIELASLRNKHQGRWGTFPLSVRGGQGQGPHGAEGFEQVDRVLDALLELILLPLVRAFRPLCRTRLMPFFETRKTSGTRVSAVNPHSTPLDIETSAGKSKASQSSKETATFLTNSDPNTALHTLTDLRTDALALLGTTLQALLANSYTLSSSTSTHSALHKVTVGIRERVALEVIRELEALYVICGEDDTKSTNATDHMHLPLGVPPPAPTQHHSLPAPATTSQALNGSSLKPASDNPLRMETTDQYPKQPLTEAIKYSREAWQADIFRTLVTKDAAWYLCSVLNFTVVSSESESSTAEEAVSPLLMRVVIEGVGKLLRLAIPDVNIDGDNDLVRGPETDHENGDGDKSCSERQQSARSTAALAIDPVTQNMLLALCEKVMSGYGEINPDIEL